jgi:hypothetical protein
MKQIKHWQDPVNVVLGAWLVASPWALAFEAETVAMASAVVLGIALIAASLGAMFVPKAWEEWTEFGIGVLSILSPWVLQFSAVQNAMLSAVVTGILIAALALWTLATDSDFGWRSDRVGGAH